MMRKKRTFKTLLLYCLLLAVLFSACAAEDTADRALHADAKQTEYGTLRWPNNELSRMLPEPESTRGEIAWNDETGLGVYVADTSTDAFKEYAERCWQKGFSVHYHLDDDGFEAKNIYGYTLFINHDENNVMLIRLESPQELLPAASSEAESAPTEASAETERTAASEEETSPDTVDPDAAESGSEDRTLPSETETPSSEAAEKEGSAKYVLNTNTKKFHLPTCSSVKDIKDKNRKDFFGSREEVIAMGYEPCKRCHP